MKRHYCYELIGLTIVVLAVLQVKTSFRLENSNTRGDTASSSSSFDRPPISPDFRRRDGGVGVRGGGGQQQQLPADLANQPYSAQQAYKLRHPGILPLFPPPDFPYPVHFITYTDDNMRDTRERLVREAVRCNWYESVVAYSPADIPPDFWKEFGDVLSMKRGGGYYIWRFPVLELAMDRVPENEYIVFVDAASVLNVNPRAKRQLVEWIEMLKDSPYDELAFALSEATHILHDERHRTTSAVFEAFNVSVNSPLRQTRQLVGGILVLRNGPHLRRVIAAVYDVLAKDPYLITDRYNRRAKRRYRNFQDHRHDQSIHSLARKLHGAVVVPWPGDNSTTMPFQPWRLRKMTWEQVLDVERYLHDENNRTKAMALLNALRNNKLDQ